VLLTRAEVAAQGRAIDTVIQRLQQGMGCCIDRVAVAGSVGKGVSVQGGYDIDLVAFIDMNKVASVYLADPDALQDSDWWKMQQWQVVNCLQQLPQLIGEVRQGRTAITFSMSVSVAEPGDFQKEVEIEFDVLLAPNLAAQAAPAVGAEAAAAAAQVGVSSGEPYDSVAVRQARAVLAPVLAVADRQVGATGAGSSSSSNSTRSSKKLAYARPSYARNIWLTEAATDFVQQAAVAAARSTNLSARVVTSTISLVKAWVRRGLQSKEPGFKKLKSFMIELIVLHAAQTIGSRQQATGVSSRDYEGRYVLELMLESLAVMVEWAELADSDPALWESQRPILFTGLVGGSFYSTQQALALHTLLWSSYWSDVQKKFRVLPAVVHPVDPLSSVFAQGEGRCFELWGVLRQEAQQLLKALQSRSWQDIMQESSLGKALMHDLTDHSVLSQGRPECCTHFERMCKPLHVHQWWLLLLACLVYVVYMMCMCTRVRGFGREALQLVGQLKQDSWEEVMQGSSLGRALRPTL
jgi:hypothetical protein